MNVFPRGTLQITEVKKFIIIFYSIGVLGFIIPWSRGLFITITPFALLLSTWLLAVYHDQYTRKNLLLFFTVAVLGFAVEVIGVQTGLIFGDYEYGRALGLKLFDTPLVIALNWLFLTYTASSLSAKISDRTVLQILIAPTLMLVYDFILEQLAPKMNMWSWTDAAVPLKNYVAWCLIGFLFVVLFKIFKVDTKNPLGALLFVSQFLFFALLYLIFNLIK